MMNVSIKKVIKELLWRNYNSYYYKDVPKKMSTDYLHKLAKLLDITPAELVSENISIKAKKSNDYYDLDDYIDKYREESRRLIADFFNVSVYTVDDYTLTYVVVVSCIHLINQDKLQGNIDAYTGQHYFEDINVPSRNFIKKILLNSNKLNKVILNFLINLSKNTILPNDLMLTGMTPTTHGVFNLINQMNYGMQRLFYDLNMRQLYENKVRDKLDETDKDKIDELGLLSCSIPMYDDYHQIHTSYPPLFLVSFLYFTKLKNFFNLDIPCSLLDCYYFTDKQEDAIIFSLNSLSKMEFDIFITTCVSAVNLKDEDCYDEALVAMKRFLSPLKKRINHWALLEGICSGLDQSVYEEDDNRVILVRRGVKKYSKVYPSNKHIQLKELKIKHKKDKQFEKQKEINESNRMYSTLGKYAEFCAKHGLSMDDDTFQQLLKEEISFRDLIK